MRTVYEILAVVGGCSNADKHKTALGRISEQVGGVPIGKYAKNAKTDHRFTAMCTMFDQKSQRFL
jgi:hypothetical protein